MDQSDSTFVKRMRFYWAGMVLFLLLDGLVVVLSYSLGSDSILPFGLIGVLLVFLLIFGPLVTSLVLPAVMFRGYMSGCPDDEVGRRKTALLLSVVLFLVASVIVGLWTMAAIVLTSGV